MHVTPVQNTCCALPNGIEFIEHHHDQSIMSLLAKTHDVRFFRFLGDSPLCTLRAPENPEF
jgi:hypothetical protein